MRWTPLVVALTSATLASATLTAATLTAATLTAATLARPAPFAAQDPAANQVVTVHATVHAAARLQLRARVDGRVARVFVQPGDVVAALDKLVQLSAPELIAAHGAADARVQAAEQRSQALAFEVERAAVLAGQTADRLAAAHEITLLAKAQAEAQEQTVRSREQLADAGRATPAEVFAARQQLLQVQRVLRESELRETEAKEAIEDRRLQHELAKAAVAEHRVRIGVLRGERDAVAARVDALSANSVLEHARVAAVMVGVGDTVQAGVTPLVDLVDARRVRIELHVPAHLAHRVGKDTAVRFVEDGEELAKGKVARYSGAVLENGFAAAWVDFDNERGRWIPGRVLQAEVELRR